MELKAKVTKEQFIKNYINIFNGGLRITSKEKEFLYEILLRYLNLIDEGLKEPYLSKLVFSKEVITEIKNKLSLSSQGLNNYKTQLKRKGVFKETAVGIQIDAKLIPQKELIFKFEIL